MSTLVNFGFFYLLLRGEAFLVCFALDDLNSFYEAQTIIDHIHRIKGDDEGEYRPPIFLVGTKNDREKVSSNEFWVNIIQGRLITHEMGTHAAGKKEINRFVETSSKTGFQVEEVFSQLLGEARYNTMVKCLNVAERPVLGKKLTKKKKRRGRRRIA